MLDATPGDERRESPPLTPLHTLTFTWADLITVHSVSKAVDAVPGSPDRLTDAARTMLEADAASAALGIDVTEAHDGTALARMRVTEQMVNGHDIAHGGYVFLLADTTFAAACNSHGPVTVAAGAEISFVASARLGDELEATAHERTRYGRNGIYDVTVRRDTPNGQEVIAEFRGRSRTIGQVKS